MKKVLVIAYHFPPSQTVGTKRTVGFCKHLKKEGWEPIVLTIKGSKINKVGNNKKRVKVYRTKELSLEFINYYIDKLLSQILFPIKTEIKRKIIEYVQQLFIIPDSSILWVPFVILKAKKIIQKEKLDLIYVSCPPFSSAISAARLKKITNLPLVVDYRDTWTVFQPPYPRIISPIMDMIEEYILKRTDYLILNTGTAKKLYQRKYPKMKMQAIYHGLDKKLKIKKLNDQIFTITYCGHMTSLSRSPELLFRALKNLKDKIKFRLVFAGYCPLAEQLAKKYKLKGRCTFLGMVSYDESLRLMQNSTLLYTKEDPSWVAEITYKTYDYLLTGVPILAEVPEGENAKIIRDYSKNSYILNSNSIKEMETLLIRIYSKFKKGALRVVHNKKFIKEFDKRKRTKELVKVFNELISQS